METLNERLFRLLGNEHGVQKKLAEHINKTHRSFSNKTITAWKKRNSRIPAEYIPEIAEFLGVSVNYLLKGDEGTSNFNVKNIKGLRIKDERTFRFQKKNKLKDTNHIETQKNTVFKLRIIENPSLDYLKKIAEFLNASELYLQTETDSTGFFIQSEIDFILRYRNLNETAKKIINAILTICEEDMQN